MKSLNPSELEVLKHLWKIKRGFLKDILAEYPEPKPAYTTVATVVSRMVKKKYIGFERLGRDKRYFPLLKKKAYFSAQLKAITSNFFNDSAAQFASFFTKNADLDVEELRELQELLQQKINEKETS